MQRSAYRIVNQLIRVAARLHQQPVRIFEVSQMVQFTLPRPRQVERVVAVSLLADSAPTLVDLPRLVSIPNRPFSIRNVEPPLEPFTKAPLHRLVVNCKLSMAGLESEVPNGEDSLAVPRTLHLEKVGGVDLDMRVALLQEGVTAPAHLGPILRTAVDVEGGKLHKVSLWGDAQAEHVLLLAGDGEVVLLSVVIHQVDLLEVVLSQRVRLEHRCRCHTHQHKTKRYYEK